MLVFVGMTMVVVVMASPLLMGMQLGSVVQAPAIHEMLSWPPTLMNPLLHIMDTKAPDMTLLLSLPSVAKLYEPLSVIVVAMDEF